MRSCRSAVAPTTESSAGDAPWPRCVCVGKAQAVSERQERGVKGSSPCGRACGTETRRRTHADATHPTAACQHPGCADPRRRQAPARRVAWQPPRRSARRTQSTGCASASQCLALLCMHSCPRHATCKRRVTAKSARGRQKATPLEPAAVRLLQQLRLLDMATMSAASMHRAVRATPVEARRMQGVTAALRQPAVRPCPRGCGLAASPRSPCVSVLCIFVRLRPSGGAASRRGRCR